MLPNRRTFLAAGLACTLVSVACHWSANWSECFYALVPLFALIGSLTFGDGLHNVFERRLRPLLSVALGVFTLSLGVAFLFLDRGAVLSWRFWLEVATCIYYLYGALIVLWLTRRSLLALAAAVHKRWRFTPGVRLIVCELVPLMILLGFAVPYAIAFTHVHRFKTPNVADPWTFRERKFETIEFTSADGTKLRGWWIPAQKASDRTLIICHGIAANRSLFLPFMETGDWLDANILMFDLRGHGESEGRTITLGFKEKDDVLAAIAWARMERPNQAREIFGLGISLGAASLAEAAACADPPLDGVILDSSFASTREMTHSVLAPFPDFVHPWLLTLGLPMADWHAGCAMMDVSPAKSIARVKSPVLILHSRGDPLIPVEHAQRLFDLAQRSKRLCIFDSPGHADAFFTRRAEYKQELTTFSVRAARRAAVPAEVRRER